MTANDTTNSGGKIESTRRTQPDAGGKVQVAHVQDARDLPEERWRWRCPEGHSNIEISKGAIYCRSCGQPHAELVDAKTSTRLELTPDPLGRGRTA